MFSEFRPCFGLQLKALCYRRLFPAPDHFPRRHRHGTRSDVFLRVTVLPHTAQLHLEHHYTSGHAWMSDEDRPQVDESLGTLLSTEQLAQVRAIQADRDAWAAEVLLGLFTPMTDTGTQPVSADQAEFFELGRSVSFDGKVPLLTLRLGRLHDEIVLDHSFVWPNKERRIERRVRLAPPGTAEALSAIQEAFGADVARAAAHFHQTREPRFR